MAILQCGFCGKKINTLLSGKYKYLDGTMCVECYKKRERCFNTINIQIEEDEQGRIA